MIRRAILVTAAAVALIVAPTAAMARASAGFSFPVTDSTPAAGVPFMVNASGAKANEAVTLTITRDPASSGNPPKSFTKTANASGVVEFAVTLTEDGTYVLVSTSASGAVLDMQSVTVSDHGAVIVADASAAAADTGQAVDARAGTAAGARAGTPAGGQLSYTGFRGMGLAVGGGVLVLAGTGLVFVARRRKPAQVPA